MIPQPPPGQGPIDPRGAFAPPPPPPPTGGMPPGMQPPGRPPQGPPPPGMYPPPQQMMMPPMPPPMYYPPPPRERSFARAIFMTLATSIFGLSIAINAYILLFTGLMSGGGRTGATQNTIVSGDETQTVAVIRLNGVIMGEQAEKFRRHIGLAAHNADVKALVIEVDSPGGSVTASDEIYQCILDFKNHKPGVKVVVAQGSLAASGGYYVSCAADHVIAQPTTITGNIGVLLPRYNFHKLAEKWGIEEQTTVSSGATFKNSGSMLQPETAADKQYWQGLADEMFDRFKQIVKDGRGTKLVGSIDEIANGKAYTASEAKKLGLIDDIGYASDAYDKAAALAGLTNKHVVRYQDPPSFLDVFAAESKLGGMKGAAGGVQINGVNVNVDAALLHEVTTPRLMYLWRGE
jgi:protease IV